MLTRLDNLYKTNQRTALNSIEKIENLYDRLKLDQREKYQFLSMNQVCISKQLLLYTQAVIAFRFLFFVE